MRVLVDGAWGFACSRRLDPAGARDAAPAGGASRAPRPAGTAARSRRSSRARARTATPVERDPFDVPLAEKIELCLRAEQACGTPASR